MFLLSGVSLEASGFGRPEIQFVSWLFPVPFPIPLGCDPMEICPRGSLRLTSSGFRKRGLFSSKP